MASLASCPRCGRIEKKGLTHNWFPVHTCRDCGEKYCRDCSGSTDTTCPECGSTSYSDYDKVYGK